MYIQVCLVHEKRVFEELSVHRYGSQFTRHPIVICVWS